MVDLTTDSQVIAVFTGGRDVFPSRADLNFMLEEARQRGVTEFHFGDCPTGVDKVVSTYLQGLSYKVVAHPADWDTHGKAAGPIRNQGMLDLGPVVVFVFSGGRGTRDCHNRAQKMGIEIVYVSSKNQFTSRTDSVHPVSARLADQPIHSVAQESIIIMSDVISSFGFGKGDASIATNAKSFKGEKGQSYRLGFALWPGMEKEGHDFGIADLTPREGVSEEDITPKFISASRGYAPGCGYFLNKGPEYAKLAAAHGKEPKTVVATIVVIWPLEKGKITKNSLFGGDKPVVCPWVFSLDKYERIKKMHQSGFVMSEYDVMAECEDPAFQKFNFLPVKDNVLKVLLKSPNAEGQELAQYVISRARALAPSLPRELGKDLTLDQLREKLGLEVSSPVRSNTAAVSEVDDLIGSMLDD